MTLVFIGVWALFWRVEAQKWRTKRFQVHVFSSVPLSFFLDAVNFRGSVLGIPFYTEIERTIFHGGGGQVSS